MINNDRIVPVTVTDLLTLYGNILTIAGTSVEKLEAVNPGEFEVAANNKTYIANEPVEFLNFGEDVTAGTIYFLAAYDFAGFAINGEATETAGAEVEKDGRTLYTATLSSSTITIAKVGF